MRARRRNKSQAKTEILKYPDRILIDNSTYQNNQRHKLKTQLQTRIEQNTNAKAPIIVCVGMGNGEFLNKYASKHTNTLCIGIELKEERILEALQETYTKELSNTLFIRISALNLDEIFNEQQISTIFINFPDPWPKKRHIKNRMTAPPFLQKYHTILKKNGEIQLKTDNPIVYEYALETLPEKFSIIEKNTHLPHSPHNIETKYEKRYRMQNKPIQKIVAKK